MRVKLISFALILWACLALGSHVQAESQEKDFFKEATWQEVFAEDKVVDYPIVFVHGIAGQTEFWEPAMRTIAGEQIFHMRYYLDNKIYHNYYFEDPKVWVWSVSYYTINPIEESLYGDLTLYSERLRNMIDLIKKITKKDKVVLIAHSMGGLVARKYMTLDAECWNSVHRILTVGSPNDGVATSIGVVGQLEDLRKESSFLKKLKTDWVNLANGERKWGVVGAVDTKLFFNNFRKDPNATDSGGPGFIAISSSIPNEWAEAMGEAFKSPSYNTEHYGFRIAVDAGHMDLLYHQGTFAGIYWAIQK